MEHLEILKSDIEKLLLMAEVEGHNLYRIGLLKNSLDQINLAMEEFKYVEL